MFCTKRSISRINSIHERCLHLIQQNYNSDFKVLLENSNEKPVHQKCIELLMIEVYKYLNGLCPEIMSGIFKLRENINNLRITEQKSLAQTALHIELVKFGKMFLGKLEIQPHFPCLRRK